MVAPSGSKKPYYEQISDRLVAQIEQGTAPFMKPWEPGELQAPYNPTTGSAYRGSNAFWLQMQGRSDPRWLTYKQAQGVDAQVMKGEKGTLIQYWKFTDTVKGPGGSMTTVELDRPRVFGATVFNGEQVQGLPALEHKPSEPAWQRHERAEALLAASGAVIKNDQANNAFYRPGTDSIHLPGRELFPSADNYYSTALHELGHWTGHPSRLNRDMSGRFGSESYAKEELRAEISSLMVSSELGTGHNFGNHAAYVGSWVKALKSDPKEILRAARDADAIKGLVLSYDRTLDVSADRSVSSSPTLDPQDVMQQAAKFAERFGNERDRERFMAGVGAKLSQSVGSAGKPLPGDPEVDSRRRPIELGKELEL